MSTERKLLLIANSLQNATAFVAVSAYTVFLAWKGGACMKASKVAHLDLDDLIFDEEDGGPSER